MFNFGEHVFNFEEQMFNFNEQMLNFGGQVFNFESKCSLLGGHFEMRFGVLESFWGHVGDAFGFTLRRLWDHFGLIPIQQVNNKFSINLK